MVKRFEIYLLNLDSVVSGEAKNSRPCVIVSPNEMNRHVEFAIVAPVSTANQQFPTRVSFEFLDKTRAVVLDQIRSVEKARLTKRIGVVKGTAKRKMLEVLQEMFAD